LPGGSAFARALAVNMRKMEIAANIERMNRSG